MFPAEALAGELLSRGHGVALVTDRRGGGFGERLPAVETHRIAAGGLAGTGIVGRAQGVVQLGVGFFQARGLLGRLRPAVAVGFGGYASVPTVLAASLLGRSDRCSTSRTPCSAAPTACWRGAPRASPPRSRASAHIGASDRATLTGNPVRPGIAVLADQPYTPPSPAGTIRILVVGGSQGARVFSRLIPEAVALLPAELRGRLRIAQQARAEDLETARANYAPLPRRPSSWRRSSTTCPSGWRAAHLVICRSGASTVAELDGGGTAGDPACPTPSPPTITRPRTRVRSTPPAPPG